MMKTERYKVIECVACVYIKDEFYQTDSCCINFDDVNVIQYDNLPILDKDVELRKEKLNKFHKDCEKLNELSTVTKEQVYEAFSNFRIASDRLQTLFPKIYDIRIR